MLPNRVQYLPFALATAILSVFFLIWNNCQRTNRDIVKIDDVFPGRPWAHVIPQLKPVEGVGGVKASDCGKCHTEIYEEWKTSTHSLALHDLQFQSELAKDSSPDWICLNCHIPVQNQREEIVLGLANGDFRKPVKIPNPGFDPQMREEGVTCATCHIRQAEDGESYILGASGKTDPPHPVKIDANSLRNRCQDCHNAEYIMDDTLVCHFQTGKEMSASTELPDSKKYCSHCHLPEVKRSIVKPELKKPIRTSHKHSFWGGGVPKNFALYKTLKSSGYNSALKIQVQGISKTESGLQISLVVENTNPAHFLPTGDPERHIRIIASLVESGHVLSESTLRIGQEWEWWPKAKLKEDNRLLPKEKRLMQINLPKTTLSEPEARKTPRVRIQASHVRLTAENAQFMKDSYSQANPRYSEQIRDLDKHYPYETQVWEWEGETNGRKIQEKTWTDFH